MRKIILVVAALALVASALAQPLPPELHLPINITLPPTTTTAQQKGTGIDLLSLAIGFVIGVIITLGLIWLLAR
jgi:hypothetical protein